MHTQLLPPAPLHSLTVIALLLLSGANLFGTEAPLTASVLSWPQGEDELQLPEPAEGSERLAA